MLTTTSLRHWFERGLAGVFERHSLNVARTTREYLAGLLAAFAAAPRLTRGSAGRAAHRPLTVSHMEALTGTGTEQRRRALRECGETALFMCGVFPGYVAGRLAGHDFYEAMGRGAYARLSGADDDAHATYGALADSFAVIADALGETVWGELGASNPLACYERWLAGGSAISRKRLAALGITPVPAAPGHVAH